MRKVSYTQMRAELSNILDAVRNGETVVVTQRGRPDTVLKGTQIEAPDSKGAEFYFAHIIHNGKKIYPRHGSAFKISFDEALSKTKSKHAKIIKALEDK